MSGSGREAVPDVREWSVGPPGFFSVVGKTSLVIGRRSQMFGSGRETLPDVREWSGGPPGCSGMVGRVSRMSGSGR